MIWGDDAPLVLDLVPWQVTVLLLVAVAALALMALDAPQTWIYLIVRVLKKPMGLKRANGL